MLIFIEVYQIEGVIGGVDGIVGEEEGGTDEMHPCKIVEGDDKFVQSGEEVLKER